MKLPLISVSLAIVALSLAPLAAAHTLLVDPAPVTNEDGAKTEPCGCVFGTDPMCPTTYPETELVVGEAYLIKWKETVQHTGSFRLAFSTKPVTQVTAGDLDANVLYDKADDNNEAGATLTTTIVVPDAPCDPCTLQLRQFMEGAASPYYYSCASVRVVPEGSSATGSTGSAGAGSGGAGQAGAAGGEGGSTGPGPAARPTPIETGGCAVGKEPAGAGGLLGLGLLALVMKLRRGNHGVFRR